MKTFFKNLDSQDYFIFVGLIMIFAGLTMVSLAVALSVTGSMVLTLGVLPFFLMRKQTNGFIDKNVRN